MTCLPSRAASLPSNKKCKTNEVYLRCGPNCPFSCQETGIQRKPCRNRCREGCFCQFGFIRFRRSCIPEKHCPGNYFTVINGIIRMTIICATISLKMFTE